MSSTTFPPRRRRSALAALAALTLGTAAFVGATPAGTAAAAVLNDPPANGHSIIVFPDRDFIHGDGWPDGSNLTVEVFRAGTRVGVANMPSVAAGAFDLNHAAGGPCWQTVTPDIRGGDLVRVTDANSVADQTPTAAVKVTQAAVMVGSDVVVKGTAVSATGGQFPLGQLQARIIGNNPADKLDTLYHAGGKRDIRLTPTYDSATATSWTATWPGLDAHDVNLAVNGSSRLLWLGRNPGSATPIGSPIETTTAEADGFGGPAPGCNAPLAKGPSTPVLLPASDSGASNTDNVTSVTAPTFTGVPGLVGPGATINLYVDNVLSGTTTVTPANTYSVTAAPLIDGVHSVAASEVDPTSGIETRSTAALSVTIDTIAPAAPAVSGTKPVSPATSTTPTVLGAAEAGSAVSVFTDATCTSLAGSGSATVFAAPGIGTTVALGSVSSFTAQATDLAGNVSPCSTTSAAYTQDSVPPPTPVIDTAPISPSKNASPSFAFSDSEPNVSLTCSMSTGPDAFTACTSPISYTGLADGAYTFKVRATDAAGNSSLATAQLTIDTAVPVVTITSAPTSPSKNASPSFSFSSKPGSTFQCSMTTGVASFGPCTSPASFPGLTDGAYTFSVSATDPAGNVGAATTSSLTIDTVAPGASITGTPPNPTSVNTPTFDFASADPTATFQCSLTLASSALDNYQPCTSGQIYPAKADGSWVFKVKATDGAGNTGTPDTYAFTINTAPVNVAPTVTTKSPPAGATGVAVATNVTATFSEAVQGVTTSTFVLMNPAGATLAASVTPGTTNQWILNPTADLAANTVYTATLTGGAAAIRDLANAPLSTQSWSFTTAAAVNVAPTLTARAPAVSATGFPIANNATATFSEAVQGVTTSTFTLKTPAGVIVPAAVTRNGTTNQWILNPTASLAADTRYTATLTGGATAIRDLANAPLTSTTWTFLTGPAPSITARTPGVSGTSVVATSNITATFSEAVVGVGTGSFTIKNPAGTVLGGLVTYNATTRVATLDPTANLTNDTRYTVTLTGGTATTQIRDTAGNPLPTTTWTFTTGPAPLLTARSPAVNATAVARTANVTATFNEVMSGVGTGTFTLKDPAGATIAATVTRSGTTNTWILNPAATLAASTKYTVSLTGGTTAIRDGAGNPLASTSWSFTTGTV